MDLAGFETWFSEIDRLTEPQRRLVWRGLAVFETGDSAPRETSGYPRSVVERVTGELSPASPQPSAQPVDPTSVAALGQRRVDSVGCSHCDSREVVR